MKYNQILKTKSFKEAEKIAEELTYKISYDAKNDSWRTRYDYIYQEDLESLGWTVYILGEKGDSFKNSLLNKGFVYLMHNWMSNSPDKNILYKGKVMFQINNYPNRQGISIEHHKVENILSLKEYQNLLINKLIKLENKIKGLKLFVNKLIEKSINSQMEELEEYRKEEIIQKALEEARKEGIIK